MNSLLNQLLNEQSDLTAVERFARAHDGGEVPDQAKFYERLLPAAKPSANEQYAFQVDLDRCSGCKACVTACHSLNGLDEEETWRDVGVLIGGSDLLPVMQHVTTACHHCLEPACAIGCPVNAYEKDPVTGIVKHLDDQCFGCQYCTMTCPYEVPKYHSEKGIVRKCDMCSDRLAVGEAPACVQACPHEAIAIQLVNVEEVRRNQEQLVPTSPDSTITFPTTTYESVRLNDAGVLSDSTGTATRLSSIDRPRPQHAHWPLIVMLVLSQLSVGMFVCLAGLMFQSEVFAVARQLSSTALFIGLLSIGAATLHLGRPQYAFRAVMGVMHSWLSREIVVFGAFAGLAMGLTAAAWLPALAWAIPMLSIATAVVGVLGVFCSVMIYVFTRRTFWNMRQTAIRFFGSTLILGPMASLFVMECLMESNSFQSTKLCLTVIIVGLSIFKIGFEGSFLFRAAEVLNPQLQRTQRLLVNDLKWLTVSRFVALSIGGAAIPLMLCFSVVGGATPLWTLLSLLACLTAETCERYLYFTAVSPDRMPGGLLT